MRISGSAATRFASSHPALVALSAATAATALWVERRARRAERDNRPKGRFLFVDGVRLHYRMRGEGPAVVLVHGNTVTMDDFDACGLADRLAENHRVIAFDRPGYGHSSRPRNRLWTPSAQAALLRAALARLEIEHAAVVGHSMGTLIALAMALDNPRFVETLVLIGGYYYPTLRLDAVLTAPVALPVLGDVMRYTVTALSARAMLDRMVKGMFAPNEVPPGFYSEISREMMLRPVQLRANAEDAAFMMPAARSLSRRYQELQMPLTLIAGSQDKVVDVQAHTVRLHDELRLSRMHVVPHCGHMAHYAAQHLIATAVDRTLPVLDTPATDAAPGEPAESDLIEVMTRTS